MPRSKSSSRMTADHDEIRRWAEDRGAKPARVRGTGTTGDVGMIRLDFPGYSGEGKLEEISWDEFFDAFDDNELALVYQECTADGDVSNFNKLIGRETMEKRKRGERGSRRHPDGKRGRSSRASRGSAGSRGSGKSPRAKTRRTVATGKRAQRSNARVPNGLSRSRPSGAPKNTRTARQASRPRSGASRRDGAKDIVCVPRSRLKGNR
jgi:hypothetical protein